MSYNTNKPTFIKHKVGCKHIDLNDIEYIEACNKTSKLYFVSGLVLTADKLFASLKSNLETTSIVRIHRSFAVNVYRIDMVFPGLVRMENGMEIKIGREFQKKLRDRIKIF